MKINTLEYSRVKATSVSMRLWFFLFVFKIPNNDIDSEEDINATHEMGTLLYPPPNILCESCLCYFLTVVIRHHPSMC
jgi:hypothetical protein